ncbi:MAG TPA: iron-containing alcohol dehydrogenase, partial [Planctomycetota bacterium]|nr:iron-containing alcohol dehydrogenase [Planctomycetota bacterium]
RVNRRVRRSELARIGEVITGRRYSSEDAGVDAAIEKIEAICEAIDIPRRLRDVGVREDQIDDLLPECRGNSMSANPREISDSELRAILEEMW